MKSVTVEGLRRQGFKVRVIHARFLKNGALMPLHEIRENKFQDLLDNKGGATYVDIDSADFKFSGSAKAECSRRDPYIKKYGVALALERAWARFEQNRQSV